MIELTRLNGKKFLLNAELVESVESAPDTMIRLTNGKTYVVLEDCQAVRNAVLAYHHTLLHPQVATPPSSGWSVIDSGGGNDKK